LAIVKKIATLTYWQLLLSAIVFGIIWFLPEITGYKNLSGSCTVSLFHLIPLFTVSMVVACILQFVAVGIMLYVLVHIADKRNFLPIHPTLLFFIGGAVLASVPQLHCFSSATVSILLFVLSLPYFIQIGEEHNVPDAVFKIISLNLLGACFAPFLFLMCLTVLLVMVFYNMISLKSAIAGLFAVVLSAFVIFSLFYLTDSLPLLEKIWNYYCSYEIQWERFVALFEWSFSTILFFAGFVLMLIVMALYNFIYIQTAKALMRFYFFLVSLLLIVSVAICFFFFDNFLDFLPIPVLLAILQISLFFSHQQKRFGDIVFVCLMICCLAYRVLLLIGF